MTAAGTGLTRMARDAAGDVAALEREADRIDPYIPLAAYPAPLRDLMNATAHLSEGLHRAANLAFQVTGPEPALSATGAAPGKLGVASARANAADTSLTGAADIVRRYLRTSGTGEDNSPSPLRRRAAITYQSLSWLDEALLLAVNTEKTPLDAVVEVVLQQSLITAALSRACGRFAYGVAEAADRMPHSTQAKVIRVSAPLRRASAALQKAAAVTARAHGLLDDELTRVRKTTAARRTA